MKYNKAFPKFLLRHPSQSTAWDPRKQKFWKSFIFIIFIIALSFILTNGKSTLANKAGHIKIGGQVLKVDLALTEGEQELGLSGRNALQEDEAMLFVFDHSARYPFWMKDMNFPIDIIWISDNREIIYIKKDARPESYPETFVSSKNAKYVLEVPVFFSDKNNLKEGDRVLFLQ